MSLPKKFISFLKDPSVDFQTRIFTLLTTIGVTGVFTAFLGDIFLGESIIEIVVLGLSVLILPLITFISISLDALKTGTVLICLGIVGIILPVSFFYGGGPYGGAIIWMTFCYLYIGLVLTGAWRVIMLVLMTVFIVAEYLAAYYRPDHVFEHSPRMFFIDSAISVILLGFITCIVVWFQNQLFMDENRRAREEAEKVEELNRAQNRFFSNMSHEIRTPINTILGLNEVTLRRGDLPDDVISDARSIEGAGSMLLAMVNDILDMSRLESGSMDIVPVSYSINDMLSELWNMIRPRAQAKGLTLKVDVDPSTPSELFGDEVRIKQILINILTNAIKYTKEGSVRLYIESEQTGDNEVMLTYAITDTGMGIKKEAMPHLFDAFKRVDEEKNRNIEGTGLGLSIVKQLVDLMNGEVTVNSVYMQGSTFVVKLRQDIVNPDPVGTLKIGGQPESETHGEYKQSFEAPDASILIVDDNALNIRVERKLLEATKVHSDTALSGTEALGKTLRTQYDVILMDHLMPEMDGIECLAKIREQAGGLNKDTPVIALTANAGSENQELYRASGFDDYLCKPVSGSKLEEMLMKHIKKEKIIVTGSSAPAPDQYEAETNDFTRKSALSITTSSLCDLPSAAIRSLGIGIIPISIKTQRGVFWDGVETVADEVVRYVEETGEYAGTEPPTVEEFENFFAEKLAETRHIIHITISSDSSDEYDRALQAASAFGNVTIFDSGLVSSAIGLVVLAACRMAQQNYNVQTIISELEKFKKRIDATFIIDNTEFMCRSGRMSESLNMIAGALLLHPMIRLKDGKLKVSKLWFGRREKARRNYIAYMLRNKKDIDPDILFITYVGLSEYELGAIEKEIRRRADFKRIIFKKASAAVSVNSGSGTFCVLYMKKADKAFDIASLIPDENTILAEQSDIQTVEEDTADHAEASQRMIMENILDGLKGIDVKKGMENCGSLEAYKPVLDIYYTNIDEEADELIGLFNKQDWNGYMVKVHAVKGTSRLIGAMELANRAQELEDAARNRDERFIVQNHEGFIMEYRSFKNVLRPVCNG